MAEPTMRRESTAMYWHHKFISATTLGKIKIENSYTIDGWLKVTRNSKEIKYGSY